MCKFEKVTEKKIVVVIGDTYSGIKKEDSGMKLKKAEKKIGEFERRIFDKSLGLEPWVSAEDEGSAILCPYQYNINLQEVIELIDKSRKEFYALLYPNKPLEWIYHTERVQQEYKELLKKWFGECQQPQNG